MGNDVTDATKSAQAFFHPHAGMRRWTSEDVSVDEDSLTPGQAVANRTSAEAEIFPTGTPVSGSTVVELSIEKSGYPSSSGAGFVHRNGTSGDYFGGQAPFRITQFENIYAMSSAGNDGHLYPCVLGLKSGNMIVCADQNESSATFRSVRTRNWKEGTGFGSWQTITNTLQAKISSSEYLHPCMAEVSIGDTNMVLLFCYRHHSTTSTQVEVYRSLDEGDSWELVNENVLDVDISVSVYDLSVAATRSSIMLLVQGGTNARLQYASSTRGTSFEHIQTLSTQVESDVVAVNEQFVMVAFETSGPNFKLFSRTVASAFTKLGDVPEIEFGAGASNATAWNDVAIVASPDGVVWAYHTGITGSPHADFFTYQSLDYGETWIELDSGTSAGAYWWNIDGTTHYPVSPSFSWWRGGVVVCCNSANNGTGGNNWDEALSLIYLGGRTTVTFPISDTAETARLFESTWSLTWLPFEGLDEAASGFATSHAGTVTDTLEAGYHRIQTTTGSDTATYTDAGLANVLEFCALIDCEVADGDLRIQAYVDDGTTNEYGVEVDVSHTSSLIQTRDLFTGSWVANTVYGNSRVLILISIKDGSADVWYWLNTWGSSQGFTKLHSFSGMTNNGGTSNRRLVLQCNDSAGCDVKIYQAHRLYSNTSLHAKFGVGLTSFSNPSDLATRPLINTNPVFVDNGISIVARGYANVGDEYTITPDSRTGISRMDPLQYPSPRDKFRSATGPSSMKIAYDFGGLVEVIKGPVVWYVDGVNTPKMSIEYHDGSSWNAHQTVNAYYQFNYKMQTQGSVVEMADASGTTGTAHWVSQNELAGAYLELDTGGTVKLRKIRTNDSGILEYGTTINSKRAVFYLDDADGTEALTGTARLWFPRWMLVMSTFPNCKGVRFIFGDGYTTAPYGSKYECNTMFFGPGLVMGRRWDHGAEHTHNFGNAITATPNGFRISPQVRPAGELLTFRFQDLEYTGGVLRQTAGTPVTANPNYSTLDGTNIAYAVGEVPSMILGKIEELKGAQTPVLLCPALAHTSSKLYTYNRAAGSVYSTFEGPIRLARVLGEENGKEWVRIGEINARRLT